MTPLLIFDNARKFVGAHVNWFGLARRGSGGKGNKEGVFHEMQVRKVTCPDTTGVQGCESYGLERAQTWGQSDHMAGERVGV